MRKASFAAYKSRALHLRFVCVGIVSLFAILLMASPAFAQPLIPPALDSVDSMVMNADYIYLAKISKSVTIQFGLELLGPASLLK